MRRRAWRMGVLVTLWALSACLAGPALAVDTINGFYGRDFVKFSGGSSTDSYDPSQDRCDSHDGNSHEGDDHDGNSHQGDDHDGGDHDAGAHGNVFTNGTITLNGGSVIAGDATAGGTITMTGQSSITGHQTTGAPSLAFLDQPACSPYTGWTGVTVLKGNASISKNRLMLSGRGSVALAPGTYCWAGITVSGGSTIHIEHGPVTISLTGEAKMSGGSLVNATKDPAQVTLRSSLVAPDRGIAFSGAGESYLTVYAPQAAVALSGGSEFFGSIIGRSLTATGGSHLHYDEDLGSTPVSTPTVAATATLTAPPPPSATATSTQTPTQTHTATDTPTSTPTQTFTSTNTATNTHTTTPTSTNTNTPTSSYTNTATPTDTNTATPTSTSTATPTDTNTATHTPMKMPTTSSV